MRGGRSFGAGRFYVLAAESSAGDNSVNVDSPAPTRVARVTQVAGATADEPPLM